LSQRSQLGLRAEALAASHLEQLGYQIVARNVRVGRCELDVIASRGRTVVFCEVRARSSDALIEPAESIDRAKIARIRRAAAQWLAAQGARFDQIRFDAASVLWAEPAPRLTYFEDAF
jgi:putative endonuclease